MTTDTTATVSRANWLAALDTLRVKEKAMTAQLDALAAERRRLPRERVEGDYEFDTVEGRVGLSDLFAGRRQLIVYHHMLQAGDRAPAPGVACSPTKSPILLTSMPETPRSCSWRARRSPRSRLSRRVWVGNFPLSQPAKHSIVISV